MFFKSKNNLNTKEIAKQQLVLTLPKRNKFMFMVKFVFFISLIPAILYIVFYYHYDSDLDLVVNDLCKQVVIDQNATIEKLQSDLANERLSHQVELSTREQLEEELKELSAKLKEAQLELDFVRGGNVRSNAN